MQNESSEYTDGNEWTDKELRTVEALMAQGMRRQERLDQYYLRPGSE